MGLRFNPPPGWPAPPEGFSPPPGWQPDPSWPPPPPGWQLWVDDDAAPAEPAAGAWPGPAAPQPPAMSPQAAPASAGETVVRPIPGYPPPGQPPGYSPYPGPGAPPRAGTNGLAVASFILGLLGLAGLGAVLGIIFGIIALSQLRRRPQRGRGLAITGLVLSGLWLLAIAGLIAAAIVVSPSRSASGQITKGGQVSIFSLRVGDCFQNPAGGGELQVLTVTAVPCTTAHNAQTFAEFTPAGSSYPGRAALIRQASQGCQSRVSGNLDKTKITSTMTLRYIFPEPQTWADGHRAIICLVADSRTDLTGSLLTASPAG
ncbi:MAG: DUF4190 domain-containing protein [Gemmatimonadota bacterium]